MESQQPNDNKYNVPFNILVCDISNDGDMKSDKLLKLLLGKNYFILKGTSVSQTCMSFIHPNLKWLYTPISIKEIVSKLTYYSQQNDQRFENTMLLLKTESIENNSQIISLLDDISTLNQDKHPMTVFLTNNPNDTEETINYVIGKRDIDKSLFSLIHNTKENVALIKQKLFSICNYYNQIGDEQLMVINQLSNICFREPSFIHRFNIIVAGRTFNGKSTLINTLLSQRRCLIRESTGSTKKITLYHHSKYPLTFYDSPGFQNENDVFNLIQTITHLNTECENKVNQTNIVLYCFSSVGRTLLDLDMLFLRQFEEINNNQNMKMPLVFIITKTKTKANGLQFKQQLQHDLKSKFFYDQLEDRIFPIELVYKPNGKSTPYGLTEIMEGLYNYYLYKKDPNDLLTKYNNVRTEKELYDLNKRTYSLSQITSKEAIFQSCKSTALGIVVAWTSLVVITSACSTSFTDIYVVLPMQIAMVSAVFSVYYIKRNTNQIKEWIYSCGLCVAIEGIGQTIASSLKLIPGLGRIFGGCIDAGVNLLSTGFIGASAITFCESNFDFDVLRNWCKTVIENYNLSIESFKQLSNDCKSIGQYELIDLS